MSAGPAPSDSRFPKLCALTFDDGPETAKTGLVLDRLERYGAVATFFVVGRKLDESTAPVLRRAVGMGCEIGNHSWDMIPMDGMGALEIRDSVARTGEAIERLLGARAAFFRPPSLAVSATLFESVGLPFAGGVTGDDWIPGTSAEHRARLVLDGVADGAIILLHDVQPDPHPTPEALDILIPELKARGYGFATLSGLFEERGVDPRAESKMWDRVDARPDFAQ